MPIRPRDEKMLDDIYAEHRTKYRGVKEDYFALLYLKNRFKADIDDFAYRVSFGNHDYGIDAYYIDRDARNLYLYQFKWSENHSLFRETLDRLTSSGVDKIFGNPLQDALTNNVIVYLKKDLNEVRDIIERVYIHFVFKGDIDAAERSEGLQNRREDLSNKSHVINDYFGREIELQIDFIADKPGRKGPPPAQSYEITLPNYLNIAHDGISMYVGLVPLHELHRIYIALQEQFFDRNIRGALSADNTPNKKIREALDQIVLKGSEEASVFPFRHNGVTLAAEKVTIVDGRLRLHVPRLLNGAQTISSTNKFLDQHADNPLLKQNRDRFDSISVVAKIIVDDTASEFVTQVTIANNQQNPVPAWSLRAMDKRQVDLADKFREEAKIFYSRQEGVFENLSDSDKDAMGILDSRDIRIRPLAQTFLAVQGDVYNMARLPEVFESKHLYERTFQNSYLGADSRAIVVCYKIGLMLQRASQQLVEVMPAKHLESVPKARYILWALLIQAILNDKHYNQYLDFYGNSLIKEMSFGDDLKKLTKTRTAPLLKSLLNSSQYKGKADIGKYDFLRTADAFKKAMGLALDSYSWQKKSF